MDKIMTLSELRHEEAFNKFLDAEYVSVYGPDNDTDNWIMHKMMFKSGARRAKEWLENNPVDENKKV